MFHEHTIRCSIFDLGNVRSAVLRFESLINANARNWLHCQPSYLYVYSIDSIWSGQSALKVWFFDRHPKIRLLPLSTAKTLTIWNLKLFGLRKRYFTDEGQTLLETRVTDGFIRLPEKPELSKNPKTWAVITGVSSNVSRSLHWPMAQS